MNPDNSTQPKFESAPRQSNQNNRTATNSHSSLVNGIQHYESMDWEIPMDQSDQVHLPTANPLTTRPSKKSNKSIVSQVDSDYEIEEDRVLEISNPQSCLYNSRTPLVNSNLDADAAFALKLQQEEYNRDTMHVNKFRPVREQPSATGGATATMSDAEYAAMLQAEEDRLAREQRQFKIPQPRILPGPIPNQPSPAMHPLEPHDIPPYPPFLNTLRHISDTDDDDEAPARRFDGARHFFEMMERQHLPRNGHQMPHFFGIIRGGSRRRMGNISDNPDDFGPDDYERLLELDKSIKKKTLSQSQINQISIEKFHRTSGQQEEDIVCSICLESYENGDELRRFICAHAFHKDCADRWLKENNICPICRETVLDISRSSHSKTRRNDNDRSNRRGPNPNGRNNYHHRPPHHHPRRNHDNHSS